jgi:CHASE2 domain-containing sensor protein
VNIPSVKQLDWPLALLGLAILMLVNINLVFNSLQGIDHALYDQQLQSLAVKADDKILIVEIDEQSLSLLGQWPWPRSYHGQMIELLTQADAGVIAYNVVFSNWSGDKEDQALASAIEKSGRTVLPLYFDRVLKQGKVAEVLPAEPLRESAVLGHVNSYLDLDGKLRSVRLVDTLFNEEEVSEARLHFSYASFLFNQPYSPLLELDLREVLIPFVTEEDYQRVSFVDLLTGQVSADQISQRSVFVGVTATSMGDPLLTPADDDGRQSPAVDINANIYQALASSSYILPLPLVMAILINSIFIVLTVVLIPRLSGLQQAGLTLMSLCLAWLISYLLLAQGYWYASGGLLVALIVIPFIWNILRLSRLFRFLRQQLKQLRQQQASDSFRLPGQGKIADHKQLE